MHVHPHQVTAAEVVSGALRFVVAGRDQRVSAGQRITIPAGTPHRFWNDGDEDAVAVQEARPALRLAEFFETYFKLAEQDQLDERGRPSLRRSALLGPEFADEIRLVRRRGRFSASGTHCSLRSRVCGATGGWISSAPQAVQSPEVGDEGRLISPAFQLGRGKGIEPSKPRAADSGEDAFSVGFTVTQTTPER